MNITFQVQAYKKKAPLQLYQVLFEEPFLTASGEHFKQDASRLLQERDVSLYMEKVKLKLEEEMFRARRFLHSSSLPKVNSNSSFEVSISYGFCLRLPIPVKRIWWKNT